MSMREIRQVADEAIEEWVNGITRTSELPSDAMIRAAKEIVARTFWAHLRKKPR